MPGARVGGWELFNSSLLRIVGRWKQGLETAQWLEAATRGDGVWGLAPAQWPCRESM